MQKTISKLTVFFDEPFWVGIYERECDGKYEVCKITFGAEPKDYEVYDFMLKNFSDLRFSPSLDASAISEKRINPKRMQREINKQLQNTGVGTKAQQALSFSRSKRNSRGKLVSVPSRKLNMSVNLSCASKSGKRSTEGIDPLCFLPLHRAPLKRA